jgi:glycosyltransferase involved in cell wall biosynthesis
MKVLLVNDYAPRFGGAERMVFRLRDLLQARGHEARVFASNAGGPADADYSCAGTLGSFRTLLQSANIDAARSMRRAIAEFRPDAVYVKLFLTQLSPLILPALRGVPAVYHAAWYRAVCPTGTKLLPNGSECGDQPGTACYRHGCLPLRDWAPLMGQMALWRRWRGAFARIVANSEWTRRVLVEGGLDPVGVIPNGVPVVPCRGPLTTPPAAMFAGRLIREKGVDVMLRAFASLNMHDARLVIAGDGPERGALEALSRSLGLDGRVTWRGHEDTESLEAASSTAWVNVVPSLWAEPFGLSTVEAAMRGTATIASASGGSTEIIVSGETGWLTPPGDTGALADAMWRVLTDRALAESIGDAARRRALAEYNEDLFADRILAILRQLAPSAT